MGNLIRTGILFAALMMLLMMNSCYYDKEDKLYPFLACDTTNVTYSQTIAPIMTANCNICHFTGSQTINIPLDTWAGVNAVVQNGKLLPAIEQTGPFPMPKSGSKLDPCTIGKIQKWINQGAPNN